MALRFLDQCAEESIAFQSGVAESTVLQMMTMQQTARINGVISRMMRDM